VSVRGLLEYLAEQIEVSYGGWVVDYQQAERSTQLSTTAGGVVVVRPLSVVFARELEPLAGECGRGVALCGGVGVHGVCGEACDAA
jgi:hypothetical protein